VIFKSRRLSKTINVKKKGGLMFTCEFRVVLLAFFQNVAIKRVIYKN
jgi:hypothetical protein